MTKQNLWILPDDTALIVVDMTNDFIPPHGALKVEEGEQTIPVINDLTPHFQTTVFTKEEHDAHHEFFASSHEGRVPFDTVETEFGEQYLWPDHCITGTAGSAFHKDLMINEETDMVVVKGTDPTIHAYSAFRMDDRKTMITYEDGKTLTEVLRAKGIKKVFVTGLAYDFCAGYTAFDAQADGFETTMITDASRSINLPSKIVNCTTHDEMKERLKDAGVAEMSSAEFYATYVPSEQEYKGPEANKPRP